MGLRGYSLGKKAFFHVKIFLYPPEFKFSSAGTTEKFTDGATGGKIEILMGKSR